MASAPPTVFLSYSTRDAVLARLVVRIFEENGVECFLAERDLVTGCQFDAEISQKIRQCSLLLVLWSSNSASSPWVNQEVGVALGQDIPVWPIAIEEINIQGVIFRNQGFYLTRHSDPYAQITRLAQEIRSTSPQAHGSFRPAVDQYIVGREARTQRIIELLEEESRKADEAYTLRIQASLSSFSLSDDPLYRIAGYHTPEYQDLLVRESEGAGKMIRRGSLKAILWPGHGFGGAYDDRIVQVSFRALVSFLEANRDFQRVRFVLGQYRGGNMFIFDTNVLVEGFKAPESTASGFQLTTVSYHGPTILSAVRSFDERFDELWKDHANACGADPDREPTSVRSYVIRQLRRLGGLADSAESGGSGA